MRQLTGAWPWLIALLLGSGCRQPLPAPQLAPADAQQTVRAEQTPRLEAPAPTEGAASVSALRYIWALDDGTKVKATDRSHRLRRRNGIFDGKRVRLFGARNEVVAFQLILEGGARSTTGVSVRLPRLGSIENAGLRDDPDAYFIGRRIELFRQHYVEVTERSHDLTWAPKSPAEPRGLRGWIPDALVPLRPAESFEVPARRNQGLWIDIYIPNKTRPGPHRGTLEVQVGGRRCDLPGCRLPVELTVLPATLPDTPSARTMLYFSGGDDDRDQMLARYFASPWDASRAAADALRARHFKLLRRHRISGFIGAQKLPDPTLARRLDGSAFSRDAGYEGPGEGAGQDIYSIHTYGGALTPDEARLWSRWLARHGPRATAFLYVVDEPGRHDFARIERVAARARPLPSFVTHHYTPALRNIEIFCALASNYTEKAARAAGARGKQVWIYNGVRPFTGSFAIDDVAISPRVNPWIQYRYRIPRWFYWESTYYKDEQGGRGPIDVFHQPINYSNRHGDRVNGDGLLIYPGRDRIFADADQGFDLPLPSIRLKNWRRGIQDVEYLVLAGRAGHRREVDALVRRMIPRALAGNTTARRPVAWPEDGERWLAARRALARLLDRKRGPK